MQRVSGGRMQKLSAFSHRNIDDGSPVSCFFHDYVQMEKEERSFVRGDVSRRSAPSRHGWRTSLLQEPTKRLVDGQWWPETSDAWWSCPVSSDACRPRPESTRTQSNFTQLSEPNYSPCVAMHAADAATCVQTGRWGETGRTDDNSVPKRPLWFWIHSLNICLESLETELQKFCLCRSHLSVATLNTADTRTPQTGNTITHMLMEMKPIISKCLHIKGTCWAVEEPLTHESQFAGYAKERQPHYERAQRNKAKLFVLSDAASITGVMLLNLQACSSRSPAGQENGQ